MSRGRVGFSYQCLRRSGFIALLQTVTNFSETMEPERIGHLVFFELESKLFDELEDGEAVPEYGVTTCGPTSIRFRRKAEHTTPENWERKYREFCAKYCGSCYLDKGERVTDA